jgi:hypothetical protein
MSNEELIAACWEQQLVPQTLLGEYIGCMDGTVMACIVGVIGVVFGAIAVAVVAA